MMGSLSFINVDGMHVSLSWVVKRIGPGGSWAAHLGLIFSRIVIVFEDAYQP